MGDRNKKKEADKMKVYVITNREDVSHTIYAIFLDKDSAESACAFLNDITNKHYDIEEYAPETIKIEVTREIKVTFDMCFYLDDNGGKIHDFKRGCLTYKDIDSTHQPLCDINAIYVKVSLPKDTADDEAKKIMLDRIAKCKAEKGRG